ncbi:MAG: hypothetical protein CVV41_06685 [Candidatus Riflebacteria bacterium HGW-Riflebacteria-1]|jgi:hypothetical protein|nr:MAG: hypothetical protein CVV41_06685 [Candidatus Riflebacteria bacterium HGW-Riflebacteria-1]
MTTQSNLILAKLKTVLTAAGFALVTTRRLGWQELTAAQFSAVIIEPGPDSQNIGLQSQAESNWRVPLRLHVKKTTTLSASDNWREQAAIVGKTIAANRQLGGLVIKAEITGKQPDTSVYEPWASGTLDLTIRYRFNELTQGG